MSLATDNIRTLSVYKELKPHAEEVRILREDDRPHRNRSGTCGQEIPIVRNEDRGRCCVELEKLCKNRLGAKGADGREVPQTTSSRGGKGKSRRPLRSTKPERICRKVSPYRWQRRSRSDPPIHRHQRTRIIRVKPKSPRHPSPYH